ncbi:SMI1/KNR4 family protein [Defluviitalea phaphyphila]|uniref:SMI1/KNR4 family protein n=1 Tax=Defluviitalea phaphyphila TaxID=1473580 RepID=UPI0007311CBC|nr:SMI1/KNR4 family protein [Defluviitalea phaphyphila]
MNIKEIIQEFKKHNNFEVKEPCGYPKIKNEHILPDDIKEFYSMCGGIMCYIEKGGFPIEILSPFNVKQANLVLLGKEYEEDISSSWYIIADAGDGNYISIDCNSSRLGRCYESFEYSHAVAGNCPIIALSFTELLNNIFNYRGDYFYWKDNPYFNAYGDAYDIK